MSITSRNINRFSKFFHHYTQHENFIQSNHYTSTIP